MYTCIISGFFFDISNHFKIFVFSFYDIVHCLLLLHYRLIEFIQSLVDAKLFILIIDWVILSVDIISGCSSSELDLSLCTFTLVVSIRINVDWVSMSFSIPFVFLVCSSMVNFSSLLFYCLCFLLSGQEFSLYLTCRVYSQFLYIQFTLSHTLFYFLQMIPLLCLVLYGCIHFALE